MHAKREREREKESCGEIERNSLARLASGGSPALELELDGNERKGKGREKCGSPLQLLQQLQKEMGITWRSDHLPLCQLSSDVFLLRTPQSRLGRVLKCEEIAPPLSSVMAVQASSRAAVS